MLKRLLSLRSALGFALMGFGAVLVVVAAFMIYPPAGVALAGATALFAGYVLLYLEARNASDRQSAADSS